MTKHMFHYQTQPIVSTELPQVVRITIDEAALARLLFRKMNGAGKKKATLGNRAIVAELLGEMKPGVTAR